MAFSFPLWYKYEDLFLCKETENERFDDTGHKIMSESYVDRVLTFVNYTVG